MVRGNIAHSALENFYSLDVSSFSMETYVRDFKVAIQKIFLEQWGKYREELWALQLPQKDLEFYFEETLLMLLNWCEQYLQEFAVELSKQGSIAGAFQALKPRTEAEYASENLAVRGFIDAIHERDGHVQIIDYKTSANSEIKDSMKLQLAIYSLLYDEKHGRVPDSIGIFFLRDRLHLLPVDRMLLERAKETIHAVHEHTSTTENIKDYIRTVTPLCKWRTGQCDFYAVCKPHG